jgi:3-hydroxyisobutyrate dehydrogenase
VEKIAFIGLGKMGFPMAARLVEAGFQLFVHDLVESRMADFKKLFPSSAITSTPADASASAGVIVTMLPDSQAVEKAVYGPDGISGRAGSGSVLIDMSSSQPSSTKKLAQLLANQRVSMLDAPVSGGVSGAQNGTLTIMAGGSVRDFNRCHDIFSRLGKKIYHVGGIGSGHAVKSLNNLLSAATMWITAEALAIGIKQGLEPAKMLEVINASSGKSNSTENKYPRFVLTRSFNLGFTAGLTYKDVGIALNMAREKQVPAIMSGLVEQLWSFAIAQGGEQMDQTEIAKIIELCTGTEIKA